MIQQLDHRSLSIHLKFVLYDWQGDRQALEGLRSRFVYTWLFADLKRQNYQENFEALLLP